MGRLTKIRELERDLSAEIIVQEEKGHYETHGPHGYSGIDEETMRAILIILWMYPEWLIQILLRGKLQERNFSRF